MSDKYKSKIKILGIAIMVITILWFVVVRPILRFNSMEKEMKKAAEMYYEQNSSYLPTGKKIATISLQKLYDKDYIQKDLRSPYTSKYCDSKSSWVKVKKNETDYQYYVYLKCGIFSSKIDHQGPKIELNGDDVITLNQGDQYKELGVKSVVDNTDGKVNPKDVKIDSSKVNTNKNGTYEVLYKIRDSFNNETIKIRTIKVVQILDKLVKKNTDDQGYYKGGVDRNYLQLDGITFKIVNVNSDRSVRIVSTEPLAAVNYNDVDEWLNTYFYDQLSDSAKSYVVKSDWCNERVDDVNQYTHCKSFNKAQNVGLLSVADFNQMKDDEGNSNLSINGEVWTYNKKSNNKAISLTYNNYSDKSLSTNLLVYPALTIRKDSYISSGTGYIDEPYKLKNTSKKLKAGDFINQAKVGEYITYSGYKWRVIHRDTDDTTHVVMDGVVEGNGSSYLSPFYTGNKLTYDVNKKDSIGFKLVNNITSNINSKIFVNKKTEVLDYTSNITYQGKRKERKSKSKFSLPSMYSLFSISPNEVYWFGNYSSAKQKVCYYDFYYGVICDSNSQINEKNIKVDAYINQKVTVKSGDGSSYNPYVVAT